MIDETPNITEPAEETVEISAQQIGETLTNINECLRLLGNRLKEVEAYVSELPTPAKTYYKPEGYEDYMNLGENFTEIYRRLKLVEEQAHPAPSTNHGKRLTALEEKVNGM
tara:strand:+ start:77 stop:409 length:333 start_codon:yes stop_codon:yes gene_type:complete